MRESNDLFAAEEKAKRIARRFQEDNEYGHDALAYHEC